MKSITPSFIPFIPFIPWTLPALLLMLPSGPLSAATMINMGTAASFGVLARTAITVAGTSTVTGDAGTASGTAIDGIGFLTMTGINHGGDAITQEAHLALTSAFNAAAAQDPDTTYAVPTNLATSTLFPGVYRGLSSLSIDGTLTLDAQGDANAVFIFQTDSTLVTGSSSVVNLTGGALASNIFWQVGSSATIGTNSDFSGNILALTSITVTTGATVDGNLYASQAAVTLDNNTVGLAVPEPSVVMLFAAGLAFPLLTRQRRQS